MKIFTDFFPIVLFFTTYWLTRNLFAATGVAIVVALLFLAITWLRHKKIETMQWISMGLVVILGGATLLFHNKIFVMWKPTALYWIMAILLFVSELTQKNGLKFMLGKQITLPAAVWRTLTWVWIAFLVFMGTLNLVVAYYFSEAFWVNFKLFGSLGLIILFVIIQSLFLAKYIEED